MLENQRLLIALADGAHARFVQLHEDEMLKTVTIAEAIAAHRAAAHGAAGVHANAAVHHGPSATHDWKAAAKEKLLAHVAEQLNEAEANGVFDALLLVAPAHTLEILRKDLNHATANRVVATIHKDLMKVPDHELASHLSPWVELKKRPLPYAAG